MCGITGFIHLDKERKANASVIKKMTDVIAYRGPDGEGYYVHNNLALGHRRLSIIDLSTGDQPMFNKEGTIALIFNGEIYNYIELREELKNAGFNFSTTSDSEVIIKAYEQWGTACQLKFNGMWAFAIWDSRKQLLFLSRDRIGEKPIHYAQFDNTLVFGSEIKNILAYGVPREPDFELTEIYLALGYIPAPFTFYKNIKKLKPGHCLLVSGEGVSEQAYWDLPDIDEGNMLLDKTAVYETFQSLLTDSVKIRMRSDVPYGAFLSGGLDSSSIVALMSSISSFPVETFTIGYKNRKYDESNLAREVAEKFRTNHHEHIAEPGLFDEALVNIAHHYDEPFGDSSAIPTGQVSRFASKKVKMVLTGDGGDEVLSGYTTYQGEKFAAQYQQLPRFIRKGIEGSSSAMAKWFNGNLRYKFNRMHSVTSASSMEFIDRYLVKAAWIDKIYIKQLSAGMKVYAIEDYLRDLEKSCTYKDPFYKLMYFNLKLSLPEDMLVKVDRMSMAYSLETRTPFLDHRLIEYMIHVHKDIKMQGYERKSVLRNTVGRQLPASLLQAPKKGFNVPLRDWFKDELFADRLRELGMNARLFSQPVIKELVLLNNSGKYDLGNFIWMLFVAEKIVGGVHE